MSRTGCTFVTGVNEHGEELHCCAPAYFIRVPQCKAISRVAPNIGGTRIYLCKEHQAWLFDCADQRGLIHKKPKIRRH